MKALSVKEPFASLICSGRKTIETRIWKTNYRGDVLIVGSQKPDGVFAGRRACVVSLVNVRPMVKSDEGKAFCEVYKGAYAWELENARLVNPEKVKGKLRLFEID